MGAPAVAGQRGGQSPCGVSSVPRALHLALFLFRWHRYRPHLYPLLQVVGRVDNERFVAVEPRGDLDFGAVITLDFDFLIADRLILLHGRHLRSIDTNHQGVGGHQQGRRGPGTHETSPGRTCRAGGSAPGC